MSYGRRKIFTDATEITAENVVREVNAAYLVHLDNRNEIIELYGYYRNKTAIENKTKEVRENINFKIGEARCLEITNFYKGYIFGEPIQYVRREKTQNGTADDVIAADINALNGYMADANKAACDSSLGKWMLVGGSGYKMTLPNQAWQKDGDEPPFNVYAPDPRRTFIVYSSDVDERPLMNVTYAKQKNGDVVFTVYTPAYVFKYKYGHSDVSVEANPLGMLPIVEYPAADYLGIFEPVVPLVDALNALQSNRLDDVAQYINSFLAILGAQVDEETYKKLDEWKMLCLPEGTDAKYLSSPMSQADVQTLKDDLYQAILTICGVPNRNGGTSTSDTGQAVELRDGWSSAETRAKDIETSFKAAEREHLKVVLRIMRDTVGTHLKLGDIEAHFTRRNYENIATKSQVLIAMLNNPWIHPEVAYASCGMFPDPESAYLQGKAWKEEQDEKAKKEAERIADSGAGAMSQVQQETGGSEGTGTD